VGTTVTAVVIMRLMFELANYGVDKVLNVSNEQLKKLFFTKLCRCNQTSGRKKEATKLVVLSSTTDSLYLAPLVIVGLHAWFQRSWTPTTPFQVKKERLFKQSIQHNRNYYRLKLLV
jgi:electron transfer flavoprotein alpha subunit